MNEEVFRSILEKAVMSEYADLDSDPEPKYSLKHRLAMKRIFARYKRNVRKLQENHAVPATRNEFRRPRLNLKKRLIIALIIVFLAALTGCAVATFISKDFRGTVYKDHTLLKAVNIENSPTTIEYKYTLAFVPEGFELKKTGISPSIVYSFYSNPATGQGITLTQCVKSEFSPNYNTEHHYFEELTINEKLGLLIDFSDCDHNHSLMVWDNEDYIVEIVADLDKDSIVNLSKLNKI